MSNTTRLAKNKRDKASVHMPVPETRVAPLKRNALLVSSEQRLAAPVHYKNELASDQSSLLTFAFTNM